MQEAQKLLNEAQDVVFKNQPAGKSGIFLGLPTVEEIEGCRKEIEAASREQGGAQATPLFSSKAVAFSDEKLSETDVRNLRKQIGRVLESHLDSDKKTLENAVYAHYKEFARTHPGTGEEAVAVMNSVLHVLNPSESVQLAARNAAWRIAMGN
jgi:ATP-dependent protease Clp ATPase subunit